MLSNTMYLVSLNYNNISYIVCFVADCGGTGGHGGFPVFGVIIMCVAIMEWNVLIRSSSPLTYRFNDILGSKMVFVIDNKAQQL